MMKATPRLLTALLVATACDDKPAPSPEKSAQSQTPTPTPSPDAADPAAGEPDDDGAGEAKDADAAADPAEAKWQDKLASRKLAASGLDIGSRLSAFEIINCETGEEYCQVCKFGGNPKIMAVGTADDEAFKKDLKDLDAIVQKYGDDKIKAFAVITDIEGGKAVTPKDAKAAQAKADALRKELAITMPIVVPAPEDGGANKIWDEYYNITSSRTVMFADGRNEVKFSAVGPADWSKLDAAISGVVAG
jgi:hypothetical protein